MKKTRIRSIAIAALLLVFALFLSLAISSLPRKASADYQPSAIFSAGDGGSVGTSSGSDKSYIRFTFDNEGKIYFRRDLALKWYEKAAPDDEPEEDDSDPQEQDQSSSQADEPENPESPEQPEEPDQPEVQTPALANPAEVHYFSMEFAFDSLNFSEFSIAFESVEENFSKESTSKNIIKFYNESGYVTAAIQDAYAQDEKDWTPQVPYKIDVNDGVKLRIDEENDCRVGEFAVYINELFIGKLTNVGANFLEYLSSASSTPRVPITFQADKLTESEGEQRILMKELNGQSFELNSAGQVEDNAPAVLVLNEKIYSYNLGKRWSLTYEAIDVCDSSVTVTRRYAMLTADSEGVYKKPVSSDYKALTTSTYFMPTSDTGTLEQYVSIYFDLDDGRSRSDLTDEEKEAGYIYLSWYAVDEAVSTLGEGDEIFDYIKVNRLQKGPSYIGIEADDESKTNRSSDEAKDLAVAYQEQVNEAAEGISAGEGSYFYLPSLRGLISSNYTDYRNLRFSVYYHKQSHEVDASANSATSLRYNALRFEIDEEGKYVFKVLASDASSNVMMYYYEGKLQEVTSSNIWDIDEIPSFTFEATYNGATIEDPGSQSVGYCEQSYTFSSFDIVALEGYETKYTLYRLDYRQLPSSVNAPAYDAFVEDTEGYFELYKDYMVEIKEYNDAVTQENEDRWNNTDNAYQWRPDSSLSFVPQDPAFYVLKIEVTESRLPGNRVTSYQVIDVRNKIDPLPDPFNWLEDNIWSVVLFSISAVLLIVIVIMIVVKPSEKRVEEIDLETLKSAKKNKNQKK